MDWLAIEAGKSLQSSDAGKAFNVVARWLASEPENSCSLREDAAKVYGVVAGWFVGRADLAITRLVEHPPRQQIMRTSLVGVAMLAVLTTTLLTVEYLNVIRDMPYPPELRIPSFWQYGRFTAW